MEPASMLDLIAADDTLNPPLTIIRYPNHIGLKMSHSVGDGRMFLTVIAAVMQTALTDGVPEWPAHPTRNPLIKAMVRTFGRYPQLIVDAVRDKVSIDEQSHQAVVEPWSGSRRTLHAWIPRARTDEFFSWGKEFAPKASRFALQVALILQALGQVGMQTSDDVRVLVDLRRYLGWRYVDGNFVAGVPMRVHPSMTPEELTASIKTTNLSGRPLLNQLLTSWKTGGKPLPTDTTVDRGGLPMVTFTNMGRSPEIECLPFRDDRPPVYTSSVPPAGPWGITFLMGENPQVMSINVAFHDNVIDPSVVSEALKLASSDPIGLLKTAWEPP
ncbi:hypothetical protein [Mycolicibacterium moriokaense]|nr:hypothetical protein [Mycolicibacterium moriokaense]